MTKFYKAWSFVTPFAKKINKIDYKNYFDYELVHEFQSSCTSNILGPLVIFHYTTSNAKC